MQNKTVFIIDAGNSNVKVAHFDSNELTDLKRFPSDDLTLLKNYLSTLSGNFALSSVLSGDKTNEILAVNKDILLLKTDTPTDMKVSYGTTNTLGMDRLCNAIYAYKHSKTEYAVVIDVGTCIKFDIVHTTEGYMGGSIAPGIDLRYKALNDYTGNLPLLSNKSTTNLVGTSTHLSIQSGVMNGISAEINGMMDRYRERFSDLTFFMTGGDAQHFDIRTKNDIFADENLTLLGLHEIYQQNA
ncbi:MAG: type III pantothenate kinase [Flavobacteriales bacterium]|nr:type III pantothenate kinase [Flavobacteriales bacterium]